MSFFSQIDTDAKAYQLGWIAACGIITPYGPIGLAMPNYECLSPKIDVPIQRLGETFTIEAKEVCDDLRRHLAQNELPYKTFNWTFIRGYFDGSGSLSLDPCSCKMTCSPTSMASALLKSIGKFSNIPHEITSEKLLFQGTNAIDFLGQVYKNANNNEMLAHRYDYMRWLTTKNSLNSLPECVVMKTNKDAVIPEKGKASDVGYDLSIIKVEKRFNTNTVLYDTGIKLRVAHGLYAEIVPRSSLSKSGYMLANSIGIIDPSYNGNLLIALTKIDPETPDIVFPFRCCQLIFRKQLHVTLSETEDLEKFDATARGSGGFGSTGL